MSKNVKVITTRLPTYLELLLEEACNVKLVYKEIRKIKVEVDQIYNNKDTVTFDEISALELTGTPLQTDLGDDIVEDTSVVVKRPVSWTANEAELYPLTIREARNFINNELRSKTLLGSVYSICDGQDEQHTVTLGATVCPNKIVRTLVYILPCCNEDHETTTINYMEKQHARSVGQDTKIKILTQKNYNLFGYNLKNSNLLRHAEHNGNISVDVSITDNKISDVKMSAQVVVGHSNSTLKSFLEELCSIQSFLKTMEASPLNQSTVINSNGEFHDVTFIINDLLNSRIARKKTCETLDLNNLRDLDVLDNLWNALRLCETLSDLRDGFHFFFEELAEKRTKVQLIKEDNSVIGNIVNGILNGRMAIPTLSFSQCLELLIELGLEKLKNDYVTIIGSFYGMATDVILKKWKELNAENSTVKSEMSQGTRLTINPRMHFMDLISNKVKLSFLDSLHQIAEFMFVYKNNLPLFQQNFYYFCEVLFNDFMEKFQKVIKNCDFKQARLCYFSFGISSADADKLIKEYGKRAERDSPEAFSVKMSSSLGCSDVITVFHFSHLPIFPPSVFEEYDVACNINDEENVWYVTKLVQYAQHL